MPVGGLPDEAQGRAAWGEEPQQMAPRAPGEIELEQQHHHAARGVDSSFDPLALQAARQGDASSAGTAEEQAAADDKYERALDAAGSHGKGQGECTPQRAVER